MSCYYKCALSALPGEACQRFYIFSREIAHWLQFGVITIFLRALIAILKNDTCMYLDRRMNALVPTEPWR